MTDKERSEQVAKVMERVCDLCVHRVQAKDPNELCERCESCQVTAAVWGAIRYAESNTATIMAHCIADAMKSMLSKAEGEKR